NNNRRYQSFTRQKKHTMCLFGNSFKIADDTSNIYRKCHYACDGCLYVNRVAMRNKIAVIFCLFLTFTMLTTSAQDKVTGTIYEANESDKDVPLSGANIYWKDSDVGTITDFDGRFELTYKKKYKE